MKMNPYKKILFLVPSLLFLTTGLAHDEHDLGYKEEIIQKDGEKIVVKTIHLNVDFKEEYEKLKEKWDQRQKTWDAREEQHRESMQRLRDRLEIDNEQYERIEKLLGMRLWTQSRLQHVSR